MGVSKNAGTPKWMAYNGKPYEQMDDLGGKPLFLETPICTSILGRSILSCAIKGLEPIYVAPVQGQQSPENMGSYTEQNGLATMKMDGFSAKIAKRVGSENFRKKVNPDLRRRISQGLVPASIGAHRPFIKLPVIWIQGMECQPTAWSMSIGSNLCMNNCKYY